MLDIQISMGILQRATSLFPLNVRKQTAIGLKSGGAQCGAAATEEGHNGLMDKVYDHLWQCLYYSQWHNNLCSSFLFVLELPNHEKAMVVVSQCLSQNQSHFYRSPAMRSFYTTYSKVWARFGSIGLVKMIKICTNNLKNI